MQSKLLQLCQDEQLDTYFFIGYRNGQPVIHTNIDSYVFLPIEGEIVKPIGKVSVKQLLPILMKIGLDKFIK